MQQLGTIAGAPAQILLDSGAEAFNYISTAFCRRVGLALQPDKDSVTVKGVQESSGVVAGVCSAVMSLGTLKMMVKFVAIDLPAAFDVILGDAWLKQTKAKLDYAESCCTVRKGKWVHTLTMKQNSTAEKHESEPKGATLATILSYAGAKRCLAQSGTAYCLVLVRPKDPDTPESTPADKHAQQLQAEYPSVFTDTPPHGGSKIQLGFEVIPIPPDSNPILRPMYRYSPMEMEEMEKQIQHLIELGYIRPSQSPFGAPVLLSKSLGPLNCAWSLITVR
jgi:hypothetical protein